MKYSISNNNNNNNNNNNQNRNHHHQQQQQQWQQQIIIVCVVIIIRSELCLLETKLETKPRRNQDAPREAKLATNCRSTAVDLQ